MVKLGTYDAKGNKPKYWSMADNMIVLSYPKNQELYVKKLDDKYSWIIKPTRAKLDLGKQLLLIARIPVANNNEYSKN